MTKIIITEDDPMMLEIYQKKFSEAGCDAFMARGGEEALDIIKKEKIKIVLSDLIMPGMDGFELVMTLRGKEYDPQIKIIILSNLFDSKGKIMEMGADGFLAKYEHTPTEVVDEVKKIIGEEKKI